MLFLIKLGKLFQLLFILFSFRSTVITLPPKIDLGLVLDISSDMGKENIAKAATMLDELLDRLSISPGTTRVALYTVDNDMKEIFDFQKHVNRKCIVRAINNVTIHYGDKDYNFLKVLVKTFQIMHKKSKSVDNQRRIYLFITNSYKEYGDLSKKLKLQLTGNDFIGFVLINVDKEAPRPTNEKSRVRPLVYNAKYDLIKVLKKLNIPNKSYTTCSNEGAYVYDECNRECKCKNGKLTNCYRIRREFTAMSKHERQRYLRAYKLLTTTSPYKEIYERYIYMHYKYFCWGIHTHDLFFPWHRWYISVMEDLLKQIDCRVTLAYWDWSFVTNNPWNKDDLWSDTDYGLGGNGDPKRDYCVQTGMFREEIWETPYWEDPVDIIFSVKDRLKLDIDNNTGHLAYCLRRAFNGYTPTPISIERTLQIPATQFRDFDIQVRHNYHDRLHNIIGGTMSTHFAANAPEFFLHHAFLDKIWYTWQKKSPNHKYVHFLQRNTTYMLGCEYTQRDLIDSNFLPRCIKVKYTKFLLNKRFKRGDEIDYMARAPSSFWNPMMQESWYGDFPQCNKPKAEKKRAYYLHHKIDLGEIVDEDEDDDN